MKSKNSQILRYLPLFAHKANEAMIDYVSDRSVAIIIAQPSGEVRIGSGTAVKINSFCLVATAGHLFDNISSESHIRIVPRGIHNHPGISLIGRSQDTSSPDIDVAWIHIEQSSAAQSGLRFLEIDDLLCGQRHDSQTPFMVQGFPAEEAVVLDKTCNRPVSLGLLTCSVESDPQIDALFLEYPPQSTADRGLELVHPGGLSGGGIWLYPRTCDSPVWSAERAKLVAITRSWDESTFRLRTEPIERWLQRVARDLPNLRDTIGTLLSDEPVTSN